MLKLAKYIKKYTGVILLIIVLLVIQANCDLSLPTYTSNIVNVGIHQRGIEYAVADTISLVLEATGPCSFRKEAIPLRF